MQEIFENPEAPSKIIFDDFYLSRLLAEVPRNEDNIKLYNQKSIQKLIDNHFA